MWVLSGRSPCRRAGEQQTLPVSRCCVTGLLPQEEKCFCAPRPASWEVPEGQGCQGAEQAPCRLTWVHTNHVTLGACGVVARGPNVESEGCTPRPPPGAWSTTGPAQKPDVQGFGSLRREHMEVPGGWCNLNSTGAEAPVFQTLPDLTQ